MGFLDLLPKLQPLGGFVGGVANLIGTSIASKRQAEMSRYNTDATIRANKAMADLQWQRDLEMLAKQNEYNSPANQMMRFKQAGLNPNLIYGQGNAGNTAVSMPRYQAPNVNYGYVPDQSVPAMLSGFQDMMLKSLQINNMQAHNDNLRANTVFRGLKNMDQVAKNWFNFANTDFSTWVRQGGVGSSSGTVSNYRQDQIRREKLADSATYQADVLRQIVNDQVMKIQLNNQLQQRQLGLKDISTQWEQYQLNKLNKTGAGWRNALEIIKSFIPLTPSVSLSRKF